MSVAHYLSTHLLDNVPLVRPIVPMRWMSNLFRLAMLEKLDRQALDAGLAPRHQPEIRRLRRSSMAPKVGRYYPVESDTDVSNDDFEPEQARQLVEQWLQTLDLDDNHHVSAERKPCNRTRRSKNKPYRPPERRCDFDDAAEHSTENPPAADLWIDDECIDDELIDDAFLDRDPFENESAYDEPWTDEVPTSSPLIASSQHPLTTPPAETPAAENGLLSQSAAGIVIALLAALLLLAATWFNRPPTSPPPHRPPIDVINPTKIVPSAVPRIGIPRATSHPPPRPRAQPSMARRNRGTPRPGRRGRPRCARRSG